MEMSIDNSSNQKTPTTCLPTTKHNNHLSQTILILKFDSGVLCGILLKWYLQC